MKRTSILAASLMCSVMLSAQTREDAVLFSGGSSLDESYLLTENVSVVFDEDGKGTVYKGETSTDLTFDGTTPVTAEFKDAFKLKANQDPDHEENYYSTFYTSGGAYKVPETATAYIGNVVAGEETDVLYLTKTDLIHQSEAVILRGSQSDITLMPSCNKGAASTDNKGDASTDNDNDLEGTDEEKTLSDNQYALSLGQHGVGFYKWNGKTIGANKAYLTLDDSTINAKAFTFMFEDGTTTGIRETSPKSSPEGKGLMYDLNGIRMNGNSHKGIVIKNGRKVYRK